MGSDCSNSPRSGGDGPGGGAGATLAVSPDGSILAAAARTSSSSKVVGVCDLRRL